MSAPTMRLGLDERRAFAVPRAFDGLPRNSIHIQRVRAIRDDTRNAVTRRARSDIPNVHHRDGWRELAVLVVLAHEDYRELERRRQVERFVEAAFVGRAIAKETHRNLVCFASFSAQSSANRN